MRRFDHISNSKANLEPLHCIDEVDTIYCELKFNKRRRKVAYYKQGVVLRSITLNRNTVCQVRSEDGTEVAQGSNISLYIHGMQWAEFS